MSPSVHKSLFANVPVTAGQCRQFAEECIAIAEHARRQDVGSLQQMAATWLQIAAELLIKERTILSDQNAPSTSEVQ